MNAVTNLNAAPRFDKNIPLPAPGGNAKAPWTLEGMEVGDSYLFAGETRAAALRNRLAYGINKRKWKVALRADPMGAGIRVWRTA